MVKKGGTMIKRNNQDIVFVRRWNGTRWIDVTSIKRWNGTRWVDTGELPKTIYEVDFGKRGTWSLTEDFITPKQLTLPLSGFFTTDGLLLRGDYGMGVKPVYITMKYLEVGGRNNLNIEIEEKYKNEGIFEGIRVVTVSEVNSELYITLTNSDFLFSFSENSIFKLPLISVRRAMFDNRLLRTRVVLGITPISKPTTKETDCMMIRRIWID